MTDIQRYFAVGLPTLTALVNVGVTIGYFVVLNGRMNRVEERLDRGMEAITDMDRRLTRVEIKLGIQP